MAEHPSEKNETDPRGTSKSEGSAGGERSVRSLRTLRGDVETIVRDQRASIVSIAAAESERRGAAGISLIEDPDRALRKRRRIVLLGASAFFVLSGALALLLIFTGGQKAATDRRLVAPYFFFTESQIALRAGESAEKELLAGLARIREGIALPLGSIAQAYPTAGTSTVALMSAGEFLSRLGGHTPAALERVALPAFMLGVHVFDGNQPFVLLRIDPYEQGFAAMLEWEPYLLVDLSPFFILPAEGPGVLTFTDEVLDNKDIRVARGSGGRAVALYSFLDRTTVLITTNENTMREVISRLTRPRI